MVHDAVGDQNTEKLAQIEVLGAFSLLFRFFFLLALPLFDIPDPNPNPNPNLGSADQRC